MLVLLVGEILVVTIPFDTEVVRAYRGWWVDLFAHAPALLQMAIAVVAANLLFTRERLGSRLAPEASWVLSPRTALALIASNLVLFLAFYWLTGHLLGEDQTLLDSPWAGVWFLAWMALGLATVAAGVAAAFPVGAWLAFVRADLADLGAASLVGLAGWGLGLILRQLWLPLGQTTLGLVAAVLEFLAVPGLVYRPDAFIVGTETFSIRMIASCSGYEGIGLLWAFVGVYLWYFRDSLIFPNALWLVPIGTVVVWLANAARIAALILIGTWFSPEVAANGFHSQAGWLLFNAVTLGLIAVAQSWGFFVKRRATAARDSASAAFLLPFLATVALAMIGRAFSTGLDWLYPARVLVVAAILWRFRRAYSGLGWGWDWPAALMGALVFGLWLLLTGVTGRSTAAPPDLASLPPLWAGAWLAFRVLGAVLVVPVVEELAFRGYLIRRLQSRDFEQVPLERLSWRALLVSSALFGVLHASWVAGMVAGVFYGLALYRRGRLGDAVVAHAVTNTLLLGYVVLIGDWSYWF